MRLSKTKLVAAAPLAALAFAASVPAAASQSGDPAVRAQEAAAEAPAAEDDEGCTCTCAACLEKHGPAAEPPAVRAEVSAAQRIEPAARSTWKLELEVVSDGDDPAEEEPIIEEFEVSGFGGTEDEMARLAREVEEILATELVDITEQVVIESVAGAAGAPGAPARVRTVAPPVEERGFLGVALEADEDGVVVAEVMDGSPAAAAGLRVDDVLFRIGDRSITSLEELREAMAGTRPGQSIEVGYIRDRRPSSMRVELRSRAQAIGDEGARGGGDAVSPAEGARVVEEPRPVGSPRTEPAPSPEAGRRGRGRDVRRPEARVAPGRRGPGPIRGEAPRPRGEVDRPLRDDVRATFSGEEIEIEVMADGTVRITGENVTIRRSGPGRGRSTSSVKELDLTIPADRARGAFDWISGGRGPEGDRARRGDRAPRRSDRASRQDRAPRRAPDRPRDAGPRPRRGDAAPSGVGPGNAELRRRIREMNAEIERLSRQVQRIGRALGDRER